MSLRNAMIAGLAILGIALLGAWQFAPSVLTEVRGLLDAERLDMLVARAGIWGPVVIVTLMTVAVVASPLPRARRSRWPPGLLTDIFGGQCRL
jgi:uncharacterized membrane protein YdjX (TVP38/TMEM64 family)